MVDVQANFGLALIKFGSTISARVAARRENGRLREDRGLVVLYLQGKTWVDRLTARGALALAVALHILAALLSDVFPSFETDEPLIWFATGTSVGLAVSANSYRVSAAALLGGVIGQVVFVALLDGGPIAAGMALHIVEAALAFGLSILAHRLHRSIGSPAYTRTVVGAFIALLAASGSFLVSQTEASYAFWVSSHAIGTFAVAQALLVGRGRWLATANPRENTLELSVLVAAVAATPFAIAYVELATVWLGTGFCILAGARFGPRIGQPLALGFAVSLVWITTHDIGLLSDANLTSLLVLGFAGSSVFFTNIVGQLAGAVDKRIQFERAATQRWQKLANNGFDAFIETDAEDRVIDLSESMADYLGLDISRFTKRDLRSVLTEDLWARIGPAIQRVRAGESVRFERQFEAHDGTSFWALCILEPRRPGRESFAGCTIYIIDISVIHPTNVERVETRAALADEQDAEQRRLAQLVHDGALQDLAAANLLVGAARMRTDERLTRASEPIAVQLERIEKLLMSGMRRLREDVIERVADIDLREVVDVEASLEETIAKFQSVNSADITIAYNPPSTTDGELNRTILQITQEALVNALLHSQAGKIDVEIRPARDGILIAVCDNGVGFNPDRLHSTGHLGLTTMSSLVDQSGGWFSLSTRPGNGTTIEVWLPEEMRGFDDQRAMEPRHDHQQVGSQTLVEQQDPLESTLRLPQVGSTRTSW